MNKLVSKNPVLRFKLGRKIVKADGGYKLVGKRNLRNLYTDGKRFYTQDIVGGGYTPIDETTYNGRSALFYTLLGTTVGDWERKHNNGNLYWYNNKTKQAVGGGYNNSLKEFKFNNGDVLTSDGAYIQYSKAPETPEQVISDINTKNNLQSNNQRNSGVVKSGTNWNARFQNSFTDAQRKWMSDNGITDARGLLKFLIDKGYGDKLGKYGADGKWGKNSLNAWNEYFNNTIAFLPETNPQDELKAPESRQPIIQSTVTPGMSFDQYQQMVDNINAQKQKIAPITLDAEFIGKTWSTPKKNPYDRSQTRDIIRQTGYEAYGDFSGALRKALRQYLNGELYDKSLLQGYDLSKFDKFKLKTGGKLVSKNPVTRFKLSFSKEAQFPR